jgi:hypothetical protein
MAVLSLHGGICLSLYFFTAERILFFGRQFAQPKRGYQGLFFINDSGDHVFDSHAHHAFLFGRAQNADRPASAGFPGSAGQDRAR